MATTAALRRYKAEHPFSQRLNEWIEEHLLGLRRRELIAGIDFTEDNSYDNLEAITKYFNETGRLIVWNGASENTIFGYHLNNTLFRAWHDYVHITNQFDFTTEGESMTAWVQAAELPSEWYFEKQLILCEVIGQVLYHKYHNEFPVNQRLFAINYLETGDITIKS